MSIEIPLMFNPRTPISALGSEFRKMQMLDADRGLLDPTIRSAIPPETSTTEDINLAGVDTGIILENNQNPSEELYQTDAQASLFLDRAFPDRPMSQTEKELQMFEDHDLDPRVRQEILVEAERVGSNMFSLQSQDFVQQIQQDIKSYNDEANLYYSSVPFTQTREGLIRQFKSASGEAKDDLSEASLNELLANGVLSSMINREHRKMEEQREARARRERFVPKGKGKTTEEKLKQKQEGKKKKPKPKDEL